MLLQAGYLLTAGIVAAVARFVDCVLYTYIYIYFYHRTLRGLQNDELPTLEPGTRSRVSVRFMAPGHKTPLARRGGAPRAGGRSPRPSGNACVDPLRLEGSPEARGVPSSGTGPSQNRTCSGGGIGRKSRAGISTIDYVRFGRIRVWIRESACTESKNVFFRDRTAASSRIMVLFIIDREIMHA